MRSSDKVWKSIPKKDDSMNIHFVGYLKTFVKQEYELLQKNHNVTAFDLVIHASSFWQIPKYFIATVLDWKNIRNSDVVWIWIADYPAIPFVLLAKIFKKPVIVNVSGFEVFAAPEIGYGSQLNPIRGRVSKWILRNATRTIVMSNAYKKIVNSLEPAANVVVIHGWIDTKLCEEPLIEKSGVVTSVAKYKVVHLVKNIPLFIEATKGMDAKVIENVPHVTLITELKSAKVYCQLSITDQFPLTLLEAMACGCIPVVSNSGGPPEIVGDVGFIVPYGDIEKTRDAIHLALLSTPADIMSVRERAGMFSIERRNSDVKKMLEEVVLR
jgi:glycosyltransferase involved in cell wall biosynthesis